MKSEKEKKIELFFPYYVNQGRLLDIYAILNGGYSEYSEILTTVSEEKAKSGKANLSANGGFKLFDLGGSFSGETEKTDSHSNENKEKKVQTVTSMLSIVNNTLAQRGYLKDILSAVPGQFVCLPVVLSINSIKSLMIEASELLKLIGNMQKAGASVKDAKGASVKDTKEFDSLLKSIQVLFDGEEIIYETDEYAVIGNVLDINLYQSVRADIIGTELKCLAQVKRVFPNGTELMKNTIFTKIKDTSAKEKMVQSMKALTDGNVFDFEAVAKFSIQGKPVYQLEIIALYQ